MTIDNFLSQLCDHCGIESSSVEIKQTEDAERIYIDVQVEDKDSGIVIGFHGEGLEALQRMVRIIFQDEFGDKKIMLNINDYRQNRETRLREIIADVAERVSNSGQEHMFHSFIPSYERFIIHSILSEDEKYQGLESVSQGDGKQRRLVIRPKAN